MAAWSGLWHTTRGSDWKSPATAARLTWAVHGALGNETRVLFSIFNDSLKSFKQYSGAVWNIYVQRWCYAGFTGRINFILFIFRPQPTKIFCILISSNWAGTHTSLPLLRSLKLPASTSWAIPILCFCLFYLFVFITHVQCFGCFDFDGVNKEAKPLALK